MLIPELFAEVRSYRDREAQVFFVSFAAIATGIVGPLTHSRPAAYFLTAAWVFASLWICANLQRSVEIRRALVRLMEQLGANTFTLAPLDPKEWAEKEWWQHGGTNMALLSLLAEIVVVWAIVLKGE